MISVIIPVFNGEQWLAEAIESCLSQRIQQLLNMEAGSVLPEIICVDDGSTDNSLAIAKSYAGIKVISQVNKGLASARNTGIMNATKDWILCLDADDKFLPNALTKISLKFNPDIDVVAPSFKTFGTSNEEIILGNPTLEDFKTGNRLGYCQAIRRSVLLEVGGYSPKMVEGYEDLWLSICLLTRGYKLVTIPEVLWMYRTKEKSMYTDALPYHKKLLTQINKDFPNANLDF